MNFRLAGETQDDGVQDCRKYLDELLTETSRLQEKLEDSLRLKVPHYFHGNSLTSTSLASQCAASAQKYADRTQTYFNFYQALQQAEYGTSAQTATENEEEEDVGVETNMQTLSSSSSSTTSKDTCSLSSRSSRYEQVDDNNQQQHNRNIIDNAVLHNNHIPSSFKSSLSSNEKHFESETYASPIPIISCHETEPTDRKDEQSKSASSLIQGNKVFSHEAASLPVRSRMSGSISNNHIGGAITVNNNATGGGAHLEYFNNNDDARSLSQGDLSYLSKSLDIPVHILKAAASQQMHSNNSVVIQSTQKAQIVLPKKAAPTPSLSSLSAQARSNNLKSQAQAWRKYCKTPAVNLCKCFEDHCVCFL